MNPILNPDSDQPSKANIYIYIGVWWNERKGMWEQSTKLMNLQ